MVSRYSEEIVSDTDGTVRRVVKSNGVPNHRYAFGVRAGRESGFQVCEDSLEISLPLSPQPRKKTAVMGMTKIGSSKNGLEMSNQTNSLQKHAVVGYKYEFTDTKEGNVIGVLRSGAYLFNQLSNRKGEDDVAMFGGGVDNAETNKQRSEYESMDTCHGHADSSCRYHHHALAKTHACTHDCIWNACTLIGWMLDGYPLYSHCAGLTSCYKLKASNEFRDRLENIQKNKGQGDDSSDYEFDQKSFEAVDGGCNLDEANGFWFNATQGIEDADGNLITGYAYVATDNYPYVPTKFMGTPVFDYGDILYRRS